jgi:outer membrane protein OmpA-like peptidoglycan-associated protein/opacity protein-like surface antigen
MQLKQLILGSAIAVACSAAAAQAATGWYMSVGAGGNWVRDADWTGNTGGGPVVTGSAEFDTGYVVAGAVGYDWGRWRAELEVAYRSNDVDCVTVGGGGPCFSIPGVELWELSQMVNVLYDLDLNGRWGASLGVGAGGNLVTGKGPAFFGSNIDTYEFAAQAIAELNYRISDRWQLFGTYHLMWTDDPNLDNSTIFGPGGSVDIEKLDHSVVVGLRFDMHADRVSEPEPPRPTPTPPRRPRQFIVFFGFNKSNLSAEAVRVVAEAAAAAKEHGSSSILVVGHTDTVGSRGYNMRLSLRRAAAVKAELVNNGITASMIETDGKGETELMIETGDSVKEPQNRRGTIDLQ